MRLRTPRMMAMQTADDRKQAPNCYTFTVDGVEPVHAASLHWRLVRCHRLVRMARGQGRPPHIARDNYLPGQAPRGPAYAWYSTRHMDGSTVQSKLPTSTVDGAVPDSDAALGTEKGRH